jgi:putative addiction module component (TIGR02574 family)
MNFEGITMNAKLSKLPIDARIKLVEELWDGIVCDQKALPFTDEKKAELDRRLDAYEADGNRGRLATESVTDIRRKL